MTREEALAIVVADVRSSAKSSKLSSVAAETIERAHKIIQSESSREKYERAHRQVSEDLKRSFESEGDDLCQSARLTYARSGIPIPQPDYNDLLRECKVAAKLVDSLPSSEGLSRSQWVHEYTVLREHREKCTSDA